LASPIGGPKFLGLNLAGSALARGVALVVGVVFVVVLVGAAVDVVAPWPAAAVVGVVEDRWRSHPAGVIARQIAAATATTMRRGRSCSAMRATLPPAELVGRGRGEPGCRCGPRLGSFVNLRAVGRRGDSNR